MPRINKLQLNNIGTRKNIKDVTTTINTLIEEVNKLKNIRIKGPSGTYLKPNTSGYSINITKTATAAGAGVNIRIAKIVSPMTAGGYYNCVLEDDVLSSYWNSSTTIFDHDTGGVTIEVLNINEETTNEHFLNSGAFIICWKVTDDNDNDRYIGFAPFGKVNFAEWV